MSQVQVTAPATTRDTLARSDVLPTRPTQVTRPFRITAFVSERAAVTFSENCLPAVGSFGVVTSLRTTSVGLAVITWYGKRFPAGATSATAVEKSGSPVVGSYVTPETTIT